MSQGPTSQGPNHGATKITASKGGGASKWLIGGLAAVVLVGGGYAAWRTLAPAQDQSEFAINNEYDETDPLRANALPEPSAADDVNDDAVAAPASADDAARRRASRSAYAAGEPVPETTIGITPINATSDETIDESESVIVTPPRGPVWSRVPTARRLSALYPARALEREREGEARLACIVQQTGRLSCENVDQTPGFGGAALRVANTLEHSPYRADGSSAIGTPVNLRVVFRMEDGDRFASR